ncbi:hypothetical protein GCM10020256_50160 [Streptomyces thermocoprophilus]
MRREEAGGVEGGVVEVVPEDVRQRGAQIDAGQPGVQRELRQRPVREESALDVARAVGRAGRRHRQLAAHLGQFHAEGVLHALQRHRHGHGGGTRRRGDAPTAAPAAAATHVSTAARVPRVVDFISGTEPFAVSAA